MRLAKKGLIPAQQTTLASKEEKEIGLFNAATSTITDLNTRAEPLMYDSVQAETQLPNFNTLVPAAEGRNMAFWREEGKGIEK